MYVHKATQQNVAGVWLLHDDERKKCAILCGAKGKKQSKAKTRTKRTRAPFHVEQTGRQADRQVGVFDFK